MKINKKQSPNEYTFKDFIKDGNIVGVLLFISFFIFCGIGWYHMAKNDLKKESEMFEYTTKCRNLCESKGFEFTPTFVQRRGFRDPEMVIPKSNECKCDTTHRYQYFPATSITP
jgi:hypothetical protein